MRIGTSARAHASRSHLHSQHMPVRVRVCVVPVSALDFHWRVVSTIVVLVRVTIRSMRVWIEAMRGTGACVDVVVCVVC